MAAITRRITRFDWTGDILSPLAVILMEVFWVYPWLVWTKEMPTFVSDRVPLGLTSLIILIAAPYLITRFFPAPNRKVWWLKLCLVILTIPVVIHVEYGAGLPPFSGQWFIHLGSSLQESFSLFRPIVPALIASAYLCWRGIRLGNTSLFREDAFRSFMFGLSATIILILVWTMSMGTGSLKTLSSSVGLHIAGFFFFGLISLAMGNFLNIRQRLARERAVPLSSRRWFVILLIIIGGIVVIGMGIASIFSPGAAGMITGFFGNILDALSTVLRYILIPFQYLAELVGSIINWLINLVRGCQVNYEAPEISLGEAETDITPLTSGLDIITIIKWVIFILTVIAVIYIFVRASSRIRSRMEDSGVEEFSESLWSWLGFTADIRLFFSRLFGGWFRVRPGRFMPKLRLGYVEERFPDDMNIREIYGHVLKDTSDYGLKHRSYETPYEYANRLDTAVPGIEEQVDGITELYVNVRYGESGLKSWETENANVLFRLLHKFLKKPDK